MTTIAPHFLNNTTAAPRRLWLITFVDLAMLLLAFFVLLFSISTVDRTGFAALAKSYAAAFSPGLGGQDGVLRAPVAQTAPAASGDNLAYLETVLGTAFARQPTLAGIRFRLTGQYLILDLPSVAAGEGSHPMEENGRFAFDLSGVLANLPNRIAVVAVPASRDASDWIAAQTHAEAWATALMEAGYSKPLGAFVQGSLEPAVNPGVRVLVLPEASE
jgi:chemotaxis protein MotB